MEIIDIFKIIAKGEKPPKKIKYNCEIWDYNEEIKDYVYKRPTRDILLFDFLPFGVALNYEVEVIDDEVKEDNDIETIEIEQDTPNSNFYIRNENGTKCGLTKHSKIIADKINEIIEVVNKLKNNSQND